jgi:hypothetical protein
VRLGRGTASEPVERLAESPAPRTGGVAQSIGCGNQLTDRQESSVEQLMEDREQVEQLQIRGKVEGQAAWPCDRYAVCSDHSMVGDQRGGLSEVDADLRRKVDAMTHRVVK